MGSTKIETCRNGTMAHSREVAQAAIVGRMGRGINNIRNTEEAV